MLKPDTEAFLQLPSHGSSRVLYPGRILAVSPDLYSGVFQVHDHEIEEGMDLHVCYELRRGFTQQSVRLQSARVDNDRLRVELEIIGDPISADGRQCFRVCAIGADLTCTFGTERDCEVVDVSATGFSVYAESSHEIGGRIDVVIHHDGEDFPGSVVIQSIREKPRTEIRYGVHCAPEALVLERALPRINLAVQRQQLRRLSRIGT